MGEQSVRRGLHGDLRRQFMNHLLEDLRALQRMETEELFEIDVRRIGAEQELFLVDESHRPAAKAMQVLAELNDPHFVHELASFNLEINLDPQNWGTDCFRRLHVDLDHKMEQLRDAASRCGVRPILIGILPSIRRSDLGLESMTPLERYFALNEAVSAMREQDHRIHIKGFDELSIVCNSVMLESCNASWQVHFQVAPKEFPNLYNIAQLALAPVLAVAANAPVLFGRRLWHETRVAVFQQAVDTRPSNRDPMDRMARVSFGRQWIKESVLEIYQEDVARFRALVGTERSESPLAVLDAGGIPALRALQIHNSTVYRWNRPCYGVLNGKPHLRIENRILPSGPSTIDEIANAMFWFGLLVSLSEKHPDIAGEFAFSDAHGNFLAAARHGLGAQFHWFGDTTIPAQTLICDTLLPGCADALRRAGIDAADVDHYLGIIDHRARTRQNGSEWALRSLGSFPETLKRGPQMSALVAATVSRQLQKHPVSEWDLARCEEAGPWEALIHRVEDHMSTDPYIVGPDEPANLVASVMVWKHIRHVPVEDADRRLIGLISYRRLLRLIADGQDPSTLSASEVMRPNPTTIAPEVSALKAIETMEQQHIDCLPVVRDGKLVGILTDRDFVAIARTLLRDSSEDASR